MSKVELGYVFLKDQRAQLFVHLKRIICKFIVIYLKYSIVRLMNLYKIHESTFDLNT